MIINKCDSCGKETYTVSEFEKTGAKVNLYKQNGLTGEITLTEEDEIQFKKPHTKKIILSVNNTTFYRDLCEECMNKTELGKLAVKMIEEMRKLNPK